MLDFEFYTFPVLSFDDFILRDLRVKDCKELLDIRSNDEVMKYMDSSMLESDTAALEFIKNINESYQKKNGITWAIATKETDIMIGYVGSWRIDRKNYRGEVGFALHPDYWRKGIMSNALSTMIDFLFNDLNLHSLEGNVNPDNEASTKLLTKFGFVKEAHFRENYYFDGKFLDSIIYSLLKSDYKNVFNT